ncbi:hypothetical protein MNBD_ALPHA09-2186 [hydrothermal vent metagenome]|uniref:Phytase-like domain-containing protein n=1 Tax=hydrothermal vent metagenome TaxID=652676 RepID=A0A3B0SXN1_9ZZZZ
MSRKFCGPRIWVAKILSLVWIAIFGIASGPAALMAATPEHLPGFERIEISGSPIRFSRLQGLSETFGRLTFRGGLVLTSPDTDFGGLSGLGISAEGDRILAITDRGYLYSAQLDYRDGRLVGISEGAKSSLKGSKGQPLSDESKAWHDAEGLTLGPRRLKGPLWVSFERRHRIEVYDFGRLGADARAKRTRLPAPLNRNPRNSGVEALARFGPKSAYNGALLTFSENPRSGGKISGYILGGPRPGPIWLSAPGGYSATGIAFLPGGDLVVLERRLGNLFDFSIRLRRIAAATIQPGATLAGEVLFEGGLAYQIDNLEGIAVHETDAGEIRLTLVSDDNFSPIQQTLLLQFAITVQ